MTARAVEVVVLGLGPGGQLVAESLADARCSVVGIDERLVGGECPHWGCVPSKMMVRAADLLAEARRVPEVAGASTVSPEWNLVARRIREEATDDWDDAVAVERLEAKGARFVRGHGHLLAPDRVGVGDEVFRATRAVVVATGSRPAVPPVPGLDGTPFWTNREAIEATEVPEDLVVLGGGSVGVELAQVFARFGSRVTVLEAADRLLPSEEPDAGRLLAEVFTREGIEVRVGTAAQRVERRGERFELTADRGPAAAGDRLLVATGRHVDLGAIGAEVLGVAPGARALEVDEHLRVTDGVWAVGDVTGRGAFTHVAVHQARIAVAGILGSPHAPASYHALPRVTFTDPEVGAVGLTEAAARAEGRRVATGTVPVAASTRGWIHKAGNDGLLKLVVDASEGTLVGATSMGPVGGEVLGLLALAVHARLPVDTLRTMIYAYPTFHRGVEDALRDLDEA